MQPALGASAALKSRCLGVPTDSSYFGMCPSGERLNGMKPSTTHYVEADIPLVSFRSTTHPTPRHVTPSCRQLVTRESQVSPEQGVQLLHSHTPLLRSALQTASIVSLPRAPRFFVLVHGEAPPLDTPFVDTRRRGKRTYMLSKHGDMKAKPCGWTLNLGTARLTITWRLPRGGVGLFTTLHTW